MADTARHNERILYNELTGEEEYRSWTDDDGILHEEYATLPITSEQMERADRFNGPLLEDERAYIARRQAQTAKRRASRAAPEQSEPGQ